MRTLVFAVLAVGIAAASPALARSRGFRGSEPPSQPQPAYSQQYMAGRGYDLYSRQPGASGIITSTTPNASGNLGGPSTGGGGGGGA